MIDALIYGEIPIANIEARSKAPPEKLVSNHCIPPEKPPIKLSTASEVSPGTGINEPNLNITSIKIV